MHNKTEEKMKEIWKDIPNMIGHYQASNLGRIRSVDKVDSANRFRRGKIKSSAITRKGYEQVCICVDGRQLSCKVHRLVAITFLDNDDKLTQVNHIDRNKLNNRVDNLEWCDQSHNQRHAFKHGLQNNCGDNHPQSKLTANEVLKIVSLLKEGSTIKELALQFGIGKGTIQHIKSGRQWSSVTGIKRRDKSE